MYKYAPVNYRKKLRFETDNCRTMTLFLSTEGVTSDTEMLSTGRFWPISCRDFTVFRVFEIISYQDIFLTQHFFSTVGGFLASDLPHASKQFYVQQNVLDELPKKSFMIG